jgi:hypothetical protein
VALVVLGGCGDLNGRRRQQCGTEKGQDYLSHGQSPSLMWFAEVRGCGAKLSRCFSTFLLQIGRALADFDAAANHEAASKFVGQRKFAVKNSGGASTCFLLAAAQLYGLPKANPVQWHNPVGLREKTDEEAGICNSPGRFPRLGANEIVTQEHDRARGPLCADRPHRRPQTGVLDEVRQFAGATAAAAAGGSRAGAASAAGGTTKRNFRLVL